MLGKIGFAESMDLNHDGVVDISDVNAVIGIMLGHNEDQPVATAWVPNYAIFGSSKSTTRHAGMGWLYPFQQGLLDRRNYVNQIETAGTVTNRPHNAKTFGSSAADEAGKKIVGIGSSLSFHITGETVDIVQLIERTEDYGEFSVYDNGKLIGQFNNRNTTMMGQKEQSFVGDGSQRTFLIDDLDSYDFVVQKDGVVQSVSMNPMLKNNFDCYAVRTVLTFAPYADGTPRRVLYFPVPPAAGVTIDVTYQVGHAMGYTRSDFNEDATGANESFYPIQITSLSSTATYGNGYPISPVLCDSSAVIRLALNTDGDHEIKIALTGGENPYFDFDFACTQTNAFMNAAFGGYDFSGPYQKKDGATGDARVICQTMRR